MCCDFCLICDACSCSCSLIGSYKSRIKMDASLDVCADCGMTPHDVKHLFACPAHPTTLMLSVWSKPVESIQEFNYLEEGNIDWYESRLRRITTTKTGPYLTPAPSDGGRHTPESRAYSQLSLPCMCPRRHKSRSKLHIHQMFWMGACEMFRTLKCSTVSGK